MTRGDVSDDCDIIHRVTIPVDCVDYTRFPITKRICFTTDRINHRSTHEIQNNCIELLRTGRCHRSHIEPIGSGIGDVRSLCRRMDCSRSEWLT